MKKKKAPALPQPVYNEEGVINPEKTESVAGKYHYTNLIREIFKRDPEIEMKFDEASCTIDIYVNNEIKYLALRELLPYEKYFGEQEKVTINVALSKKRFGGDRFLPETLYQAFKGNPLFNYIYYWADPKATFSPYCWVVMNPEIMKYPESDLHQIFGTHIELAEKTAGDIFNEMTDYTFFCTDDGEHPMPDTDRAKKFND